MLQTKKGEFVQANQLSLLEQETLQEVCEKKATECFDCDKAWECPIINETLLKLHKRNGVNNYTSDDSQREVHPKNSLNELTGAEWLYFTKTLLTTSYSSKYAHKLRKAHGANKPPELMKHLIEFFTKQNDRVLDPFAGVGGTLIGAAISNPPRECVGIEINPRWIEIYGDVIDKCNSDEGLDLRRYEMLQGDSLEALSVFQDEQFQFITTDPPYNLHLEKTMCNGQYESFENRKTDYDMQSEDDKDLANLNSYEEYLDSIEQILGQCYRVLQSGKYMTIILRDAYQNGEYIFTHVDIAKRAQNQGFIPKGEIIWYGAGTRLRPYGYPYAYVPNISHQNIIVLQKSKATKRRKTPSKTN